MSFATLTIRPPEHHDFVHGYPGIPPRLPDDPPMVKGIIELRVGPQGVWATSFRIELRKVESLPGGGKRNTFYDCVGHCEEENGLLHSRDFPFSIRIPESIPPSVSLDNGAGIQYELLATMAVKGKKRFLRTSKSIVISAQSNILIDKHELHSTWPLYWRPDPQHLVRDGVILTVDRNRTCYGPGDQVSVVVTLKPERSVHFTLSRLELTLKETTKFRSRPHSKSSAVRPTVTSLCQKKTIPNFHIYGDKFYQVEMVMGISRLHTTPTVYSARHIDITHVLSVKAVVDGEISLIMDLPVFVSNWRRDVSSKVINQIGSVPTLSPTDAFSIPVAIVVTPAMNDSQPPSPQSDRFPRRPTAATGLAQHRPMPEIDSDSVSSPSSLPLSSSPQSDRLPRRPTAATGLAQHRPMSPEIDSASVSSPSSLPQSSSPQSDRLPRRPTADTGLAQPWSMSPEIDSASGSSPSSSPSEVPPSPTATTEDSGHSRPVKVDARTTTSLEQPDLRPECKVYKNMGSLLNKLVSRSTFARFQGDLQDSMDLMRDMDMISSLVESNRYRGKLIELSKNMEISDHPEVRQALDADEKDMSRLLWQVLCSGTLERSVLELTGYEADCFMNLICQVMDRRLFGDDELFYRKAHRLLLKLSQACDKIPSILFIRGVRLIKRDVAGGGFADIHKASYNGAEVALKRVRIFQTNQDHHRVQQALYREALEWRNLRHPYVLPFLGMDAETFPSHFPCLVTCWMSNGTIIRYIRHNDVTRINIEKLMLEVAQGLAYLHSKKVIHGDLHGRNILINDEGHACLSDFGLSRSADLTRGTHTSRPGGTVRWMAPELLRPEAYGRNMTQRTEESDVYALGCVFLEVSTLEHPFFDVAGDIPVTLKVLEGVRPNRPPNGERGMSDGLWGVVQECWKQQPSDRPNMIWVIDKLTEIDFAAG